jgi:hypothetical protein
MRGNNQLASSPKICYTGNIKAPKGVFKIEKYE